MDKIRSIFGVAYVYKLDKSYDLVVEIESNSGDKITSAISAIRKVHGILNTDTMVGFKE